MNAFEQWLLGTFAAGCVNALLIGGLMLIQGGFKKAEQVVSDHLPPAQAANVNAFLDTVDHLTGDAVQSINNTLVLSLKQKDSFNAETAAAVKQQVIGTVLANLGPLKEQFAAAVGPLESVIGNAVEKHVLLAKGQTSMNVKTPA